MLNCILAGQVTASRWRASVSGRVRHRAGRDAGAASRDLYPLRLVQSLAVLLGLVQATATLVAPTSPALTGGVVDDARILPADAVASLAAKLKTLEERTADHFVVATVTSLQGESIDEYAYQLGRAWGIDQKNKDNVVILLVAPNERKVRIEVGHRLESSLTDALSQAIIENAILPRFRANDMAGGIESGVDAIIQVLDGNVK